MLARLLIACFICACSSKPTRELNTFQHSVASMGTVWTFRADFNEAKDFLEIQEKINTTLISYELAFSDWIEESELRQWEKRGLDKCHKASSLMVRGLEYSNEAFLFTEGRFDPTVGAVLWGVSGSAVGWSLKQEGDRFCFSKNPLRLSFGGIVKGMAVGNLSQVLWGLGSRSFYIDAGGGNLAGVGEYLHPAASRNDRLWFLSRSRVGRFGGQKGLNIIDPTGRALDPDKSVEILCEAGKNPKDWERNAALGDAVSKAWIIDSFPLPKNCRSVKPKEI